MRHCPSTVTSYDSLRHHLYKKHKDVLKDTGENNSREFHDRLTLEPNTEMESSSELHPPDDSPRDDYAIDSITHNSNDYDLQLDAAKFILKLRDGKKLPQTVTDEIIQDVSSMVDSAVERLKESVIKLMK